MANVLLINPPGSEMRSSGNAQPPLGPLYLAAELLQAGHKVEFIDGVIYGKKKIIEALKKQPDVIGIQIMTPQRHKAFEVIDWICNWSLGSKIVMGGPHASTNAKQILENYALVDACCEGEGEKWLLNYVETGKATKAEWYQNLDDLPFPAWHLMNLWDYMSHVKGKRGLKAHVMFGRGCPYACSFCSSWNIWKEYRVRSPRNMADEIKYLYNNRNVRHLYFVDDIMTYDREATIGLCEEILRDGMKLGFNCLTRADCVDIEMLKMLKAAGCYKISYGIESGSPEIIRTVHKDKVSPEVYVRKCEEAIRITSEAGIGVSALMMIGNPGETNQTISESLAFLKRTRPEYIGCHGGVWILPRTALYQQAKNEGLIDDDYWLKEKGLMFYKFSFLRLRYWKFRLSSYRWDFLIKHIVAYFIPRQMMGRVRRELFLFIRKRFA